MSQTHIFFPATQSHSYSILRSFCSFSRSVSPSLSLSHSHSFRSRRHLCMCWIIAVFAIVSMRFLNSIFIQKTKTEWDEHRQRQRKQQKTTTTQRAAAASAVVEEREQCPEWLGDLNGYVERVREFACFPFSRHFTVFWTHTRSHARLGQVKWKCVWHCLLCVLCWPTNRATATITTTENLIAIFYVYVSAATIFRSVLLSS